MVDTVDWNALAADVLANFAATGQWFATDAPPPPQPPVDWNALAAEAEANFAATGRWFLGPTPPPSPPPLQVDWNALAARVLANFEATGQWFLDELFPSPPTPSAASYILFSQASVPPGTRDLWQPQGLVGDAGDTVQGLVDGHPAAVPLSAFDAFTGTEHVARTWSIFGYASDASGPDGKQLSGRLLQQLQSTAPPDSFQTGSVLAGPAGTPENPYVALRESAEINIGQLGIALQDADWGGLQNLELLERQPPSIDVVSVRNFEHVALKFIPTQSAGLGAEAAIGNVKRGEADFSAVPNSIGLSVALTSDGPQGDNTFTIKGSARGNDDIIIIPGSWGSTGTTETRLGHLTGLINDGSVSKVVDELSAGHSVLDASRTHAALEVSGGPDAAGTSVTPAFSLALAEPGGPGRAVFGGEAIRADLFYPGLTLGEAVPISVLSPTLGPVETIGHAVLATRAGSTTPEVALEVVAPLSFVAVEVKGDNPPGLIETGKGLTIASAGFTLPSRVGPPGPNGAVQDPGDGALILASQGPDTIHYRPGSEGGLAVQGFDKASDHILLEGARADQVRIYDFTEHANTPQASAATLITFDDPLSGAPLHSLIYLPGVSGLSLGHEIVLG